MEPGAKPGLFGFTRADLFINAHILILVFLAKVSFYMKGEELSSNSRKGSWIPCGRVLTLYSFFKFVPKDALSGLSVRPGTHEKIAFPGSGERFRTCRIAHRSSETRSCTRRIAHPGSETRFCTRRIAHRSSEQRFCTCRAAHRSSKTRIFPGKVPRFKHQINNKGR